MIIPCHITRQKFNIIIHSTKSKNPSHNNNNNNNIIITRSIKSRFYFIFFLLRKTPHGLHSLTSHSKYIACCKYSDVCKKDTCQINFELKFISLSVEKSTNILPHSIYAGLEFRRNYYNQ